MSCRLDKFIWSVRQAKTRSIATEMINKGRVRQNDQLVKAAKEVKVGDELIVIRHTANFRYKVIGLIEKRVGAKFVEQYIIDITPEEEKKRFEDYLLQQKVYREQGTGKPTKKQRRDLDDFLENW